MLLLASNQRRGNSENRSVAFFFIYRTPAREALYVAVQYLEELRWRLEGSSSFQRAFVEELATEILHVPPNRSLTPSLQLKEVDDVVYEADCSMITIREGEVNIGANALVSKFLPLFVVLK